ncbi:hypothetical protein B0T25DRAFT_512550 [Lasiosphaeria hispida]|uniref:Integral membrane protein n=1 Tax=Lasiosphaeria hispida TaxID=260671 RepID=A0AAJ0MJ13_9PEZI|nr:hypothetical protein B0T25DRAFT_512550 [Lasiosphaeria hispida]
MATTTVFNEAALPTCVTSCGVLYDVNGACVAQNAANLGSCFCGDPRLTAFSTGTAGVCDSACTANPGDLGTIQGWYSSFCGNVAQAAPTTTGGATPTPGSNNSSGGGGGGTWFSTHYQWVIFLIIMVVAVIGIWVGACIWRRRYLRKKDRQYALGANLAHATESGRVVPNDSNAGSLHVPGATMFQPAPLSSAGVYHEKPKKEKKKWIVRERT